MSQFEIEIKTLLGDEKKAKKLRENFKKITPRVEFVSKNSQLNHYFDKGDFEMLFKNIYGHISDDEMKNLEKIIEKGEKHSVRTRKLDDTVIFVVKASIDDTTSFNGISRMEFEANVEMTLDELDKLLLVSGFEYQAKWSRKREEYKSGDMNICIDKNAGYGYLAEFERVVEDEKYVLDAQNDIRKTMEILEVEELPQDRLERMFAYYNKNWRDYYGTDKIFVVD